MPIPFTIADRWRIFVHFQERPVPMGVLGRVAETARPGPRAQLAQPARLGFPAHGAQLGHLELLVLPGRREQPVSGTSENASDAENRRRTMNGNSVVELLITYKLRYSKTESQSARFKSRIISIMPLYIVYLSKRTLTIALERDRERALKTAINHFQRPTRSLFAIVILSRQTVLLITTRTTGTDAHT